MGAEFFGTVGNVVDAQLGRLEQQANQELAQEQEIYATRIANDFSAEANKNLLQAGETWEPLATGFQEEQVKWVESKRLETISRIKDKDIRRRVDAKLAGFKANYSLAAEKLEIEKRRVQQEMAMEQNLSDSMGSVLEAPEKANYDYEVQKLQNSFTSFTPELQAKQLDIISKLATAYISGKTAQLEKRYVVTGEINTEQYKTELQLLKSEVATELFANAQTKNSLSQYLDAEEISVVKAARAANEKAIKNNLEAHLELYEKRQVPLDEGLVQQAFASLSGEALEKAKDSLTIATALIPIHAYLDAARPEQARSVLSVIMMAQKDASKSGDYARANALSKALDKARDLIEEKTELMFNATPDAFENDYHLLSLRAAKNNKAYVEELYARTGGRVPPDSMAVLPKEEAKALASEFSMLLSDPTQLLLRIREVQNDWDFALPGGGGNMAYDTVTRQIVEVNSEAESGLGGKLDPAFMGVLPFVGVQNPTHSEEILNMLADKQALTGTQKKDLEKAVSGDGGLFGGGGLLKQMKKGLANSAAISNTSYNFGLLQEGIKKVAKGYMTRYNLDANNAVKTATENLLSGQVDVFDAGGQTFVFDIQKTRILTGAEKNNLKQGLGSNYTKKLLIEKGLNNSALADRLNLTGIKVEGKTPRDKLLSSFAATIGTTPYGKKAVEEGKGGATLQDYLSDSKFLPVGDGSKVRLHFRPIEGVGYYPAIFGRDENGQDVYLEYSLKEFAEAVQGEKNKAWAALQGGAPRLEL